MLKLPRNIIQIISRNSNWKAESIKDELDSKVYAQGHEWKKLIYYLLITLGVSFTVSGIIFFFAFNWDDMPKFVKFGLIEALIIACIVVILKVNLDKTVKKIILSGAALLVGALFAVFGQVYQTGADSYSLFLVWAACILIWTIVGNFAPLWLIFMALLDITIFLYFSQIDDSWFLTLISVFLLNVIFAVSVEVLSHKKIIKRPTWLLNIAVLTAVIYISLGIIDILLSDFISRRNASPEWDAILCFVVGLSGLVAGGVYGYKNRNLFYSSSIGLSFLVIIACFLLSIMKNMGVIAIFFVGLYIIFATIFLVKVIIYLNRTWNEME